MTTTAMKPRLTSLAPQFLVDDLDRSIAYYVEDPDGYIICFGGRPVSG